MKLKDVLKGRKNSTIVSLPEIKIGKYWSFEAGNYFDTINKKPTKDFYLGLKFRVEW